MDRLSDLSDELLLVILSFLPTHIAARTSVLSRRFRGLWESSPSLDLNSRDFHYPHSKNFVKMAHRALLHRNPSQALLSLRLDIISYDELHETRAACFISLLISKALSLRLRHLAVQGFGRLLFEEFDLFSRPTLTSLRSLSLRLFISDPFKLTQHLPEMSSLEDLHLEASCIDGLNLVSKTIRKLKLVLLDKGTPKLDTVELFLPSLETLHLELHLGCLENASHFKGKVPLLRKAVIVLDGLYAAGINTSAELLNIISHVEELSLRIKESEEIRKPVPILFAPEKDMMNFPNLKHLDVTSCFHKHNFEAIIAMFHGSPTLESLNLVHEAAEFCMARGRKKKDWRSELLPNAEGNNRNFRCLHLEENKQKFMKWLCKKSTSK